ncbi:hypothetical protein Pcinc_035976 [Petrolisthes cinctipes]|uniref:Uncharacterized protein n=1 Tax=Petrolisthes cinctipes TaxID=88211 RepID=A0AAE1BX60_PETCI|nr:hypothetical protein Pcinc_035976 [Petrolisthes cinctipes]
MQIWRVCFILSLPAMHTTAAFPPHHHGRDLMPASLGTSTLPPYQQHTPPHTISTPHTTATISTPHTTTHHCHHINTTQHRSLPPYYHHTPQLTTTTISTPQTPQLTTATI